MSPDGVPLDAQIVAMGELHDIAEHHANQADWVARMAPAAIVFEMLEPTQGALATRMQDAAPETLADALNWEERGWPDFTDYAPIFAAADGARLYGGGVPRDTLGDAVSQGAAQAMGEDAILFGLDLALPLEEQDARENLQHEAHCGALPSEMLPGMVEAQRLRDATLARAALQALDETGGPVAIITGNGHARRDWGVPLYLGFARPEVSVISIGQYIAPETGAPFDAWVVSDVDISDRADPCDAFN
ncbi:ChaN family lipoprotein [Maribius pontilimi]|uniref:ChaN family lipoprotein n=1 Tax=Palleronia pontilimi TaxID=1964209 RepID=A0A934IED1_9RHOB|nr:ChaN family lipoprotein [Palleronia pontilimi]MBJ3761186.1 ChaN family lipoprotein [Palleronia pontilimi]